jgi:hypothetical protein
VPVASLNTARAGAGITALHNGDSAFVYAVGGMDDTGAVLGTYEVMTVTLSGTDQTVSAWNQPAGGAVLPANSERWQLAAFTAEPTTSSNVPTGHAYIYAGAGLGTGSAVVAETQAFPVNLSTGELDTPVTVKSMDTAGYGSIIANNTLYVFGGGPASSSMTQASSAHICAASGSGCSGPAPTLANNSWNSLGGISLTPRYLMGSTLESSFVYLVGGTNGTAPLATTLTTLW